MADQSTTSIVLAWTEPLVVGAAGLRGAPTAAGNRDVGFSHNCVDVFEANVDFRIPSNLIY